MTDGMEKGEGVGGLMEKEGILRRNWQELEAKLVGGLTDTIQYTFTSELFHCGCVSFDIVHWWFWQTPYQPHLEKKILYCRLRQKRLAGGDG